MQREFRKISNLRRISHNSPNTTDDLVFIEYLQSICPRVIETQRLLRGTKPVNTVDNTTNILVSKCKLPRTRHCPPYLGLRLKFADFWPNTRHVPGQIFRGDVFPENIAPAGTGERRERKGQEGNEGRREEKKREESFYEPSNYDKRIAALDSVVPLLFRYLWRARETSILLGFDRQNDAGSSSSR